MEDTVPRTRRCEPGGQLRAVERAEHRPGNPRPGSARMTAAEELITQARAHAAAAQFGAAAAACRRALAADPGHPAALHLLGELAFRTGQFAAAVGLFRGA